MPVPNLLRLWPHLIGARIYKRTKASYLYKTLPWWRQTSILEKRITPTQSNPLLWGGVKNKWPKRKWIIGIQTSVLSNAFQVFLWPVKLAQLSLGSTRTQWVCVWWAVSQAAPHNMYHCTVVVLTVIKSQMDTCVFSTRTNKSLAIALHSLY